MDEPSLYNRALSAAEILAIYNSSTIGKCTAPPVSVFITWPTNNQFFVTSPTNILVSVTGYTTIGTITGLALYNGATKIGATNVNSGLFLWTNALAGTNTLTAFATNNTGTTASTNVTVI